VQLKALIDSQLSDDEQADLVRHLDGCECCQHSLQDLAAGGAPWAVCVPPLATEQPPTDSAFWPALRRLEETGAIPRSVNDTPTVLAGKASVAPVVPAPPPATADLTLEFLSPPQEPNTLGRLENFHVLRVIGRGGMGMVLEALDQCLQRKVAIKVMDPKFARDETARKRFCREARAAAAITHDNVVAIHEVDLVEEIDLPYLVMQLIAGESLEDLLNRQGPLPLLDIVRIGMQTAQGLAAAHAQGLVHRDIKPANILLEEDGKKVRLSDFGLARAAEDVKLTQTGFVAGTPLYMSPEQARAEAVDHRSDLFSLGSVLYAMCTGKPPFDGSSPYAVLRRVTDEEPKPIEDVNPAIPDWLIAVIDRLHAKKPADRYQSAAEVADVLAGQLIVLQAAQPKARLSSGTSRRAPILPRRRRLPWWQAVLAGVAAFLLLQGGLLLSDAAGLTHVYNWHGGRGLAADDPGPAARATLNGNAGPIWSTALSPDGHTLAMAIDDGTVKLWDLPDDRIRTTIYAHAGPVWQVTFSPDGSRLATASDDGAVKVWDPATPEKELQAFEHPTGVRAVGFSPDGKRLVTGDRKGFMHVWDIAEGKELAKSARPHHGVIMSVAYSPDGKSVASASGDKRVKVWDAATLQQKVTLAGHTAGVYAVAFAPDGKTLASGSWDRSVRLWDVDTGDQTAVLKGHAQDVWSVAFSPDGRLLASGSEDHTVKVWDVAKGEEVATFRRHTGTIYTVTFARDGRTLATGGRDGTVKLWGVAGLAGK
jgi:tRNA A-37 threonylcarbamoyl transferase component Bud32/Tol biopolymer transport system component